ncbi:hypothetical protein FOL46_003932, partial [Perkinsus olseni]
VTNVGRSAPHTCGPPNSEVKVAYNTMRAAASADTSSGLGDIYSKTLTDKDDTTIRRLPKRKSIINNMRLVRQKALNLPPPPKAVSGFDIPAQYQSTTIAGIARQTLYYDSGRDDVKRILVWCDMASMQEALSGAAGWCLASSACCPSAITKHTTDSSRPFINLLVQISLPVSLTWRRPRSKRS